AVFYRGVFALFGLNPLPYRIFCFLLLFANCVLLYRFCVRLSGSRDIGAMACLIGAYHAHLADLYYSTGTVYDLGCCTLYLGAFVYYAGGRERESKPGWGSVTIIILLYILALGTKEIAVTLAPVMLAYCLLFPRPQDTGTS